MLIEPATMSFSAAFARAGYPTSPKDSSLLQRLIEAREVANLVCNVASPCLPQRMAQLSVSKAEYCTRTLEWMTQGLRRLGPSKYKRNIAFARRD
jgi:hypothetical protein